MDLRALVASFAMVLLAELGDKTQLAIMMLSAQSRAPLPVFVGAALALILTSVLGVVFGQAVTRLVPVQYVQLAAGAVFVVLGGVLLLGRGQP